MPMQFTVLASGSSGNASLLEVEGLGVLIDAGLGPRLLASRLTAFGCSWRHIHAVLLTHTHSDHWSANTFHQLRRLRIPIYCHADHQDALKPASPAFAALEIDGLVRSYEAEDEFDLGGDLKCKPLTLRHDGGPCFGFRFQGPGGFFGQPNTLAYVADLGSWTRELAQALVDVDILAVEFNHDVELEQASRRSPFLIARVLGDDGHLSNDQAASLVSEVLKLSKPGRLQHLIQLHLSRECNRPPLAVEAARKVLADMDVEVHVHTAAQDRPGPRITLGLASAKAPRRPKSSRTPPRKDQPIAALQTLLPGMEGIQEGTAGALTSRKYR